jgi:hypothetical protein
MVMEFILGGTDVNMMETIDRIKNMDMALTPTQMVVSILESGQTDNSTALV